MVSDNDCGKQTEMKATHCVDNGTSHDVFANTRCTAVVVDTQQMQEEKRSSVTCHMSHAFHFSERDKSKFSPVRYTYGPTTMIWSVLGSILYHLVLGMTSINHNVLAGPPRPQWTPQSTCGVDEDGKQVPKDQNICGPVSHHHTPDYKIGG